MNPEDELPKPAKALLLPPALDMLGIDELKAYIGMLEREISRVNAAILAKDAHKSAAAAFFRTPGG